MKKIIYLFFCLCTVLSAQDGYYGGASPATVTTPNTAKVASASGATVNLSTGAVQKFIPIHTISQNGISWPVGLQYRFSGLKVMEEPSSIGLGWDLVATGAVTREVRGLPDDHPKGYYGSENIREQFHLDTYYNFGPLELELDFQTLLSGNYNNENYEKPSYPETNHKKVIKEHHAYLLAQGMADAEPDVFHVAAGNLRFSFKLDHNLQPYLLSHHNVQINFNWDRMEVTDSEGVLYIFEEKEIYTPVPEDNIFVEGINGTTTLDIEPVYPYTRSWYLTEIRPPNTTASIQFSYTTTLFETKAYLPKIYSYKGKQAEFLNGLLTKLELEEGSSEGYEPELQDGQDPYVYPHTWLDVDVTLPVISQISFKEGSLNFITANVGVGEHPIYTNVEIRDFHEKLINDFQLITSGDRRLLTQINANNQFAYGFEYYNAQAIPDFKFKNDSVPDDLIDPWGYYKDDIISGGLKEVKYKTGGKSEIIYESNVATRKINYTPSNPDYYNYDPNINISVSGANEIGNTNQKTLTRTFENPTSISLSHYVKITKYGAKAKLRIFKENGSNNYLPYYQQTNSSFEPQLWLDLKGSNTDLVDGEIQTELNQSKTFSINPGTYTFFIETTDGAEANINISYSSLAKYRNEAYNYTYGGLRVKQIKNVPDDVDGFTVKEYAYVNEDLTSSAKFYTVLKEMPEEKNDLGDPYEISSEAKTDIDSYPIPFYVKGRGVPIYYEKVTESIISSDTEQQNGKTVYIFEEPYFFESELDFNQKDYYDRLPKGVDESGIRLKSVQSFKNEVPSLPFKNAFKLISEKLFEYEPAIVDRDIYGNSKDPDYPYAIKVSSKKRVKRDMHYPDWLMQKYYQGFIENPQAIMFEDFEDNYINKTQAEFESYALRLMTAVGFPHDSPLGSNLRYMATGVTNMVAEKETKWQLTSDFDDLKKHEYYVTQEYKETNIQYLRKRVISRIYSDIDPSQFAESIQEFEYDEYQQLVAQQTTNSKGETKRVQYYYPYHSEINDTNLIEDNRISSPVKTEMYLNEDKQSTAVVNFASQGNLYAPSLMQSAKDDNPLLDQMIYHLYDESTGNPLETSAKDGIHTIYVWGYQNTLPIATITNASYIGMPTEVQSLINNAKLASDNDTDTASENNLRTALTALRNHSFFNTAQMVTNTYDPLIGVTSVQDTRGRSVFYTYDAQNRLQYVKDQEGNILSENQYNYRRN